MTTTCPCGKPSPAAYLCPGCARGLERDLQTIADLWPELDVTLTRQAVMGRGGGGRRSENPLPFHAGASEARAEIGTRVVSWLRDLAGDRIPDEVTGVPSACAWMLTYMSAWVLLPQVVDMADEMREDRKRLVRIVGRPPDRVVVGKCDICGQQLTAEPAALTAVCDPCERVVDVSTPRKMRVLEAHMVPLTRDQVITVAARMHRMRVTTKTIDRWITRGEVTPDEDGLIPAGQVLLACGKARARHRREA